MLNVQAAGIDVMSADVAEDVARLTVDQVQGATGHVVIVEGKGDGGADAVAIWHVSPTGVPTGAWIALASVLANDVVAAGRLLRLTARRALFAWDTNAAQRVLDELAEWAKHPRTPQPPAVLLPEVLAEISEHRSAHAAAVDEYRRDAKSKIIPLIWRRDVPAAASWHELVDEARLRRPAAFCPIASEARHLVKAAAWAAELWQDTETVRSRRRYLLDRFGPATTLPPVWLEQLRAGQHNHVER